ncbi:septum formation family protein [Actinomyces sp. ZJ308]|uniref:septum formation family protein n=1 Tax=Actinomyces sp. ZJ308 TaxID=2708342 RepID=UPI00141F6329|nr:septum formation family protein [Actinomyces sp. ZJ308]
MRTLTTLLALPVAAALTMGLSSCSLFSSGTSTATKDLEVGNCYNTVSNKAGGNNPVGEVTVVDCAKAHTYEVIAQTTFPDDVDKLPNEGSIKSLGEGFCQGEEFTKYVGVDAASSGYQIEYLSPSDDTWAKGDRKISCVVAQGDKSEVKGSAKNSKK